MSTFSHPRLTFITGKGGVGKTALALALTKSLKDRGFKVQYNCFDQTAHLSICQKLELKSLELDTVKSAEVYMGKKLGGQTIARWVMKTPFFHSLFHMLPGLGMMIVLGHLIDLLENDPELHLIVDSPSSGHALTMFEASHNFKEMFVSGKIVEDINRMHNFLYSQENVQVKIVGLPTLMALQESEELKKSIQQLNLKNVQLYINDTYHLSQEIQQHQSKDPAGKELPEFLKLKLQNERQVLENHREDVTLTTPHYSDEKMEMVVRNLAEFLKQNAKG